MGFLVSPGVDINEIDATNVIPAVSTSIGGLVGNFRWGPAEEVINVGSEKALAAAFGKPSLTQYADYYQGAQFLQYGNSLNVYRTVNNSTAKNSSSSSDQVTGLTIANAGKGFIEMPTLSAAAGSDAQNVADIKIDSLFMTEFFVTNVGSGYKVGDTFTSNLGTGTEIVLTVAGVDNLGKLQSLTTTNAGALTSIASSVVDGAVASIDIVTDDAATAGSSNKTIPLANTTNLAVGMTVTSVTDASNITSNSKIASISAGVSITLDKDIAENIGNGDTIRFTGAIENDLVAGITGVAGTSEAIWTYGTTSGGTGSAAQITPILAIKSVSIENGGKGYTSAPSLTVNNDVRIDTGNVLVSPHVVITNAAEWETTPTTFSSAGNTPSITASVGSAGILIKNRTSYDGTSSSTKNAAGNFIARCPGDLGNSLKVSVITNQNFDSHPDAGNTTSKPGVTTVAGSATNSDKEIHIVVIDEDGLFTGVAGSVLETYEFLSVESTAVKADGSSNYYKEIINTQSAFLFVGKVFATSDVATGTALAYSLTGGSTETSTQVSEASRTGAYIAAFGDPDQVDINLLIGGACTAANANKVIVVAETRKDCVAFVSPLTTYTANVSPSTAVTNLTSNSYGGAINSSSYGVLDSSAIYVYDKYNDVYNFIGASGTIAGLCANTDDIAEPWFSPAGYNRGQLRGVVKLALNPTQGQRDTLYKARINPLVSFPGQGTMLFGDKTAQSKPSAFDRINVRRLFIVLEKAIATAAKFQLFELNDQFTRATFRNVVEPFLRGVKGRRGVTDFLVICDETNNTGQVIDSNQFVADIFIKPARSINFITLNFIATRTGVEFSEIAGQ